MKESKLCEYCKKKVSGVPIVAHGKIWHEECNIEYVKRRYTRKKKRRPSIKVF